jgi:hypothetical protein
MATSVVNFIFYIPCCAFVLMKHNTSIGSVLMLSESSVMCRFNGTS